MPTSKPRINLTFRQEHYELISRLAKVQGTTRTKVLMEFIEQVLPVLERVVVVAEAASRAQEQAKEGLRSSLERAEAAVAPLATAAMGQLDWVLKDAQTAAGAVVAPSHRAVGAHGRSTAARRHAATSAPVPVIRGPAPPRKPSQQRPRRARHR